MQVNVTGGDKWKKYINEHFLKMKKPTVKVGVLGGATHSENHQKKASAKKEASEKKGKKKKDSAGEGTKKLPNLVEIAFWNEFGTKRIPARSFLRSTHNVKHKAWLKDFAKLCKIMPMQQALDQVGGIMVADVIETIKSGIAPDLSDTTLARREAAGISGTTPLMASREMITAISHQVVEK